MAIYKNKDIETNINERGADLGNINVNFYTEDNGTASIRIKMKKQNGTSVDFNKTDMLPRLDLYAQDGSIFTNEPVDIVLPEQGLIQYKVSDYAIRHEGKMDCKLFLENGTESVHVANFYFVIKGSGITGAVGKEIRVEVLEDMVRNVMTDNAMGLLNDEYKQKLDNDLKGYLVKNKASFKGDKGEEGEKGDKGETGSLTVKGKNLLQNTNFSNGFSGYSILNNDATQSFNFSTLILKGKGNGKDIGFHTSNGQGFTGINRHKIYTKVRIRTTGANCVGFKIYTIINGQQIFAENKPLLLEKPNLNTWYNISGIIKLPDNTNGAEVRIYIVGEFEEGQSLDKGIEVHRPFALDLSSSFGIGSEPSLIEFNTTMNKFTDMWFDKEEVVKTLNPDDIIKEYEGQKIGSYILVDDFSTTDWTTTEPNTNLVLSKNKRLNLTGKSSVHVSIKNSQGTARNIDRKIETNLIKRSNNMMIKLWIEDTKAVEYISVYFGNESDVWTNNGRVPFKGDGGGDYAQSGGILRKGWNYLPLNISDIIKTNNFDITKPIKRLRISVTPKTNETTNVVFDSIWSDGKGDPKFVITFDDAWRTVYENAYPKMKEAGIVGTTYVIGEYISNVREFSNWFMTVDMLKELEKNGWSSGNHTWMHNYYYGGNHNAQSYVETIEQNRNWMLNNGIGAYDSGALHVCYPNGEYDQSVISMLKTKGFKSGRSAGARGNHPIVIDKEFEIISRSFSKNVTLEQAKSWIDIGLESGGTTFLQFHQIPIDDTTSNGQENPYISWSKDKFEAFIDYIAEKGIADNFMTHAEWYDYVKRNDLLKD